MSLRVARAATRIRPAKLRLSLQRRGYADPVSDKIKLTLALPHQVGPPSTEQPSYFIFMGFLVFLCLYSTADDSPFR